MSQITVNQLYSENQESLNLSWIFRGDTDSNSLNTENVNRSSHGLIGHLNFLHPNWIQIFSRTEAAHFATMTSSAQTEALHKLRRNNTSCLIISDDEVCPNSILNFARTEGIPVIATTLPSLQIIWVIRTYLGRVLAEHVTQHGVLLDVLGVGTMITGKSGVGKSELALELISRGSGLVADDVVELFHIAPKTLEGRSPALLKDYLEVRGLGMLNIRTIFGETAVRRRKNLKLIVELVKVTSSNHSTSDRLPLTASTETILGVDVRKVQLPVAAGRNLAVLIEAAVRNFVLQLRGNDSTAEFMARQNSAIGNS